MRFGLCCIFNDHPVKFRVTTARVLSSMPREKQLEKLSEICRHNAENLLLAMRTVDSLGIGAFRIMSGFFPRMTHPVVGYRLDELPDADNIRRLLSEAAAFRHKHNIRLSFHPDQFITLSSPRPEVVENSIREIEYQTMVAELIGADVITIHGGGAYGEKEVALERFRDNLSRLSAAARSRLAVENDDRLYTVHDLLPLCKETALPLVYDVHHHRCNPDDLPIEEATGAAAKTWTSLNREPYFHISSPRHGWGSTDPRDHADYIDIIDFPRCWLGIRGTIDVEAKAKEPAVIRLMQEVRMLQSGSVEEFQ